MTVEGINHVTLSTSDVGRSVRFYIDVLGCSLVAWWPDGAYLLAGDLWLALVRGIDETRDPADYSHVAFHASPAAFAEIAERCRATGVEEWQDNWTEGKSLYLVDPSGRRIEIHTTTLSDRVAHAAAHPWEGLDIEPEQ